MKNWIGGFTTATLLIYGVLATNGVMRLIEENKDLKSQLKKEEEE